MKTYFLFASLFSICFSSLSIVSAENEGCTDCRKIPVKKISSAVLQELIGTMPLQFCKEGGFARMCFDISFDDCMKDMADFFNACSVPLKNEIEADEQTISCLSREHCSEQGAIIGQEVGRKLGSCGGTKLSEKHCQKFKINECVEGLRSLGVPESEINNIVNSVRKYSI